MSMRCRRVRYSELLLRSRSAAIIVESGSRAREESEAVVGILRESRLPELVDELDPDDDP